MSDFHDIKAVEQRLRNANNELHRLVPQVALARQVKEFASDRRKNLLARHTAPALKDNSSAAAETIARASESYLKELAQQENEYRSAEEALAKWSAAQATFDAARSILSLNKETFNKLQG